MGARKLKKLVRHPGKFFRDYLIKRFPLPEGKAVDGSPEPHAESLIRAGDFGDLRLTSVERLIDRFDLCITKSVAKRDDVTDVSMLALPELVNALRFVARQGLSDIHLYGKKSGDTNIAKGAVAEILKTVVGRSSLELVVTNQQKEITLRRRIILWSPRGAHLEAISQAAPVKRVVISDDGIETPDSRTTDLTEVSPIDAVYTWVNSADRDWRRMLSEYKDVAEVDPDRFQQSDELRYSLRSLALYAPWIRCVYILSNCAPPPWFRGSERFRWVWHHEIMPAEMLPTFNSHAIETMLHKVPGISEKFLYLNDDFFLLGFVDPQDFFSHRGCSICRLEPYGTVQYLAQLAQHGRAEEWQCAAVNSAKLIERDFGFFPTRMHRHVPYALDRGVYEAMEESYSDDMARVRLSRFRHSDDVSFTSFFYHHYAIGAGRAIDYDEDSYIVRHTNMQRFQRELSKGRKLRFFCVNDGGGSASSKQYTDFKRRFLESLYPFKSGAESP